MATVTVLAPGKVNLTLDILGVLPNGYHEMEMLMHAVSLEITLTLTEIEGDEILVSCSDPAVPLGEKNLVYKAAKAFFAHCGKSIGVSVHIEKKVPREAGMAGGSATVGYMRRSTLWIPPRLVPRERQLQYTWPQLWRANWRE